ncbi:hypothetical protein BDN72DRAFT_962771 [Pluteus cervinus]|uniref:Uncharacterized protein n=1 Tax=Pluteus cervinus TaxID=181527 RepID=A0ACD3AHH5_9AGAR|nr:hypothetical protein BDN72DRAFT_962771 [Pluteus cervinus]
MPGAQEHTSRNIVNPVPAPEFLLTFGLMPPPHDFHQVVDTKKFEKGMDSSDGFEVYSEYDHVTFNDLPFVIGPKTFLSTCSVSSRSGSTRYSPAYILNPSTGEDSVPYLKYSWRTRGKNRKNEWEIYQELCLHHVHVRTIPKTLSGEDLSGDHHHPTSTQEFMALSRSRYQPRFRTSQRFRLVIDLLDCHLQNVGNIRNAVIGIRDAAHAQVDVAEKAKIIHRDISPENIMVRIHCVDEQKIIVGYLIDWDVAVDPEVVGAKVHPIERVGTWYFVAARLIPEHDEPIPRHNRLDDIESLFNVLVYIASHFAPHRWGSSMELTTFIWNYFYLGTSKTTFILTQGSQLAAKLLNNLLGEIIRYLASALAARYPQIIKKNVYNFFLNPGDIIDALDASPPPAPDLGVLINPRWFVIVLNNALKLDGWDNNNLLVKHSPPDMLGINFKVGYLID